TGLCRIHGRRAATASAELTCPVNRATNRSFAPCVPYQEFLAYDDEITRVKFRLSSLAREMIRCAHARWMRIATARVAAANKEASSDLNAGVRRQSAPSEWSARGSNPVERRRRLRPGPAGRLEPGPFWA